MAGVSELIDADGDRKFPFLTNFHFHVHMILFKGRDTSVDMELNLRFYISNKFSGNTNASDP